MKLLNILASPRGANSRTTSISNVFLTQLKVKYPELTVEDLDLTNIKLPVINGDAAESKYTSIQGGKLDADSQKAWDEIVGYSKAFLEADMYLITCPMWNFTIPYMLKHYIDVIIQPGILFAFTATGVEGLAKNKKMICVTSRGNDYGKETQMNAYDFQEPYLRAIFGFIGIYDVSFINAQPLDLSPELTKASLDKAMDEARELAANCELNRA